MPKKLTPEEQRARRRQEIRDNRRWDRLDAERAQKREVEKKLEQLRALLVPNAMEIRDAAADLVNFKPYECPFMDPKRRLKDYYETGDELTPLICESYLYNIFGKEDARSILARVERLLKAVGIEDIYTLYDDRPLDEGEEL